MNTKYPHLFSPLRVKNMILKNRIVATPVGLPFDPAKGGAAMVFEHSVPVNIKNAFWNKFEYAFSRYSLGKTKENIMKAHSQGAKMAIELIECGNQAKVPEGEVCWGPCDGVNDDGCIVKAMTEEEMVLVAKAYGQAAADSKKLGYDEVFLHFAHGWLPAEFMSPLHNHRTDEYGGSLENRAKFPMMILKEVRKAVGDDYPIDMRISAVEWIENSITFEDTLALIKMFEPYIDMVHISSGLDKGFGFRGNVYMATTIFEPNMHNVEFAAEVKRNVSIPVTVVGGIETPEMAEEIIASGKADLVGIGRAFLADPQWANKAKEGRPEAINSCLRCLMCYHISTDRWNAGCSVNPSYLNEEYCPYEWEIEKNKVSKKVVVIGAGPAGIKAALAADKKGNDVTLIEKENEIGGLLRYISKEHYKQDTARYFNHLKYEIANSNVKVMLNTVATKEMVEAMNPDYVIIAIGAEENKLNIKGSDKKHVTYCLETIGHEKELGNNVVIIGGGVNGAELGLALAEKEGKNVTIVEITDKIASSANKLYQIGYHEHLNKLNNIRVLTETKALEIKDDCVVVEKDGVLEEIPCDNVVISVGMKAKTDEAFSLYGITPDTFMAGDCVKARIIKEAVYEGYTAGVATK